MSMSAPRPILPRPPVVVVVLGVVGLLLILGPVLALGIRVPWSRVGEVLADPATAQLLTVSFASAAWATVITVGLGVPLAVWLRLLRRGGRLVRLLVLLPLAMPPVVGGLALTAAVGRRGVTAPLLDALGLQFAFAFPGVVLAHVFIALPFVVVTVDAAARQLDPEVGASAAGVGMSPGEILRKIQLPALLPAIATGAGLAFARSLGEFGTTLTFAGSMPGVTRTMPLGIYLERETDPGRAYVLGAVLIIAAVLVLGLAALPAALARTPEPRARRLGELDLERLRTLTAPVAGGQPVLAGGTAFPANRITAVVGPNGSGKSTLMGRVAGRLDGGDVDVDTRGVVLLTQRPGLPPTATVAGAVTMVTRDARRTTELLDAAGLTPLRDIAVPALSGGQAAQVALLRALAARPSVLILDEPLAAVDVASADRWRRLLASAAQDRTTLLVTHDPLEVATLSEHLVVLAGGEITAAGPTADLLTRPPDDFVATLAGIVRIVGIVTAEEVDTVTILGQELEVTGTSAAPREQSLRVGDTAVATFAPEATTLRLPTTDPHRESARNVWTGVVESVSATTSGAATIVHVTVGGHRMSIPVTRRSVLELGLAPGTTIECVTKAVAINVYPQHRRIRGE